SGSPDEPFLPVLPTMSDDDGKKVPKSDGSPSPETTGLLRGDGALGKDKGKEADWLKELKGKILAAKGKGKQDDGKGGPPPPDSDSDRSGKKGGGKKGKDDSDSDGGKSKGFQKGGGKKGNKGAESSDDDKGRAGKGPLKGSDKGMKSSYKGSDKDNKGWNYDKDGDKGSTGKGTNKKSSAVDQKGDKDHGKNKAGMKDKGGDWNKDKGGNYNKSSKDHKEGKKESGNKDIKGKKSSSVDKGTTSKTTTGESAADSKLKNLLSSKPKKTAPPSTQIQTKTSFSTFVEEQDVVATTDKQPASKIEDQEFLPVFDKKNDKWIHVKNEKYRGNKSPSPVRNDRSGYNRQDDRTKGDEQQHQKGTNKNRNRDRPGRRSNSRGRRDNYTKNRGKNNTRGDRSIRRGGTNYGSNYDQDDKDEDIVTTSKRDRSDSRRRSRRNNYKGRDDDHAWNKGSSSSGKNWDDKSYNVDQDSEWNNRQDQNDQAAEEKTTALAAVVDHDEKKQDENWDEEEQQPLVLEVKAEPRDIVVELEKACRLVLKPSADGDEFRRIYSAQIEVIADIWEEDVVPNAKKVDKWLKEVVKPMRAEIDRLTKRMALNPSSTPPQENEGMFQNLRPLIHSVDMLIRRRVKEDRDKAKVLAQQISSHVATYILYAIHFNPDPDQHQYAITKAKDWLGNVWFMFDSRKIVDAVKAATPNKVDITSVVPDDVWKRISTKVHGRRSSSGAAAHVDNTGSVRGLPSAHITGSSADVAAGAAPKKSHFDTVEEEQQRNLARLRAATERKKEEIRLQQELDELNERAEKQRQEREEKARQKKEREREEKAAAKERKRQAKRERKLLRAANIEAGAGTSNKSRSRERGSTSKTGSKNQDWNDSPVKMVG
ncbi:unnamed protein product, partial [Amoebophrya sp. A120]